MAMGFVEDEACRDSGVKRFDLGGVRDDDGFVYVGEERFGDTLAFAAYEDTDRLA